MKKVVSVTVLCALVGFYSCKKSSPTNSGTQSAAITATIDGKTETFNVNVVGKILSYNTYQMVSLSAAKGTAGNDYAITLNIQSASGNVQTGTYNGLPPYTVSGNGGFIAYSQQNLQTVYEYDATVNASNATIVITSLTSTHAKGTFHGMLSLENSNVASLKSVTNGTFDIDIK